MTRLGDLLSGSAASNPYLFAEAGNYTYFTADTPAFGREVWSTNGTAAGTKVAADISPGMKDSDVSDFFPHRGELYFAAGPRGETGQENDIELWRTTYNGGAVRIMDIAPGPTAGSQPSSFVAVGDTLYFSARVNSRYELWKAAPNGGASKVGELPSFAGDFTAVDGGFVYDVRDEMWFSDGTGVGAPIKEFDDLTYNVGFSRVGALDGEAYFSADDDGNGFDVWRTDGTAAGTVKVRNFDMTSAVPFFAGEHAGFLYFVADDGTTGRDLWRTSGTGASKVELVAGTEGASVGNFEPFAGTVVFAASTAATGRELYKLDAGGSPVIVEDTSPGAGNGLSGVPAVAGDLVYFVGDAGGLYSSDATLTATGTALVRPLGGILDVGAARGEALVFAGRDGNDGYEPWISDGTAAGTNLLRDLNTDGQSSSPGSWAALGDRVVFSAAGDGVGRELHVTDGTSAGTRLVKDLNPGAGNGFFGSGVSLALSPTRLVSSGSDGTTGGLLVSDGTSGGTQLLPTSGPSDEGVVFAGKAYYPGGTQGASLISSDGTLAGTGEVFDFDPQGSDNVHGLHTLGGSLLFNARQAGQSDGIWRLGATGDPSLVKQLPGREFIHKYSDFIRAADTSAVVGDTLYFSVKDEGYSSEQDIELWKSDGTTDGTVLVKRLGGAGGSAYGLFSAWGDQLVFTARDSNNEAGPEVWASDGTEAGTRPISAVAGFTGINDLTVFGEEVLFITDEGQGRELYATDGTPASTRLVKDINPSGSAFANVSVGRQSPRVLAAYEGHVYFAADDGSRGRELWRSDGTSAGTELFRDFQPGALEGAPSDLAVVGDSLYFGANDGTGVEPWSLSLPDTTAPSLGLVASKKQKLKNKVVVKVKAATDEAAKISLSGKASAGSKKFKLKSSSATVSANAVKTLTLVAKNAKTGEEAHQGRQEVAQGAEERRRSSRSRLRSSSPPSMRPATGPARPAP